ncbi:lasso peptide biosynthesis PqqD family chaperone [Streptomyces sp. NPDC052020]|uniref:lasso peptide biosynthesis PqqD family chaperone n=1 Tax=Streptomyces sp. NPDC052020 TaxID=3155677 RepID=UPI00343F43DD
MSQPLRLRRDVTACDTEGGMVLLDERTGRYWLLNSTGTRVLRRLLDGASPEQIADDLAAVGGVTPQQVTADVEALLAQLQATRLTEKAKKVRQ